MLRLSICVFFGLLTVFEIILANNIMDLAQLDRILRTSHDVHASRTGKFGFNALENIRKTFCHSFCTSADTMPYFANLICAIKCPELYLPHNVTTTTSNPTTISGATTNPAGPSGPAGQTNPPSPGVTSVTANSPSPGVTSATANSPSSTSPATPMGK